MADILSIHHACVDTKDIDESIAYYEKLGFYLIRKQTCDFGEYAMMRQGTARIELIQNRDADSNHTGETGPIAHIGFDVDDVENIFDKLKSKGIVFQTDAIERSPEPMGGLLSCSTVGPSGEIINFYHFLNDF